jgi:hypothetical protein
MPPKKSTTVTKKSLVSSIKKPALDINEFQSNNVKLMKVFEKLTKTLESISKTQDDFNTNFTNLQNYTDKELNEMDYTLRLKNEECYNSLQELSKDYKEKEFKLNIEYDEKRYNLENENSRRISDLERSYKDKDIELAKSLLENENFTIITNRDYASLNVKLTAFENKREEFEKKIIADMHKELNARLKTQELQHNVATSDMKARIENQNREIASLQELIASHKSEIQAQRELTKEVAQATQKQLTQNFGK